MTTLTFLGCGNAPGVPHITGAWGNCDPNNPKNRRTRSSILVTHQGKNVLIDATPDVKWQFEREKVTHIDAILLTHAHYDHMGGIEDLRALYFSQGKKTIPVWGDGFTLEEVYQRCSYLFKKQNLTNKTSDPKSFDVFETHLLCNQTVCLFEDLKITPFKQDHGSMNSLGFRFDRWAYSTDVKSFPTESLPYLFDLDLWIVDCTDIKPRKNHAHLDIVLSWVDNFKPKRTLLTHMSHFVDYETICAKLPQGVLPAYDGLVVNVKEQSRDS